MTITWDSEKGPSDEQIDDAKRVLIADYWTSIRSIAKGLADEVRKGDVHPSRVDDRIHETADGSHWVIYTYANYHAIMCSDHDPWEDVEDDDNGLDPRNAMSVLAYYCVRNDLREQLECELGCAPEDWTAEGAATAEGGAER
jgi:hypothetical protein